MIWRMTSEVDENRLLGGGLRSNSPSLCRSQAIFHIIALVPDTAEEKIIKILNHWACLAGITGVSTLGGHVTTDRQPRQARHVSDSRR